MVCQQILFCDHFVKCHGVEGNTQNPAQEGKYSGIKGIDSYNLAYMYGYSLKFMKWLVDVYLIKV